MLRYCIVMVLHSPLNGANGLYMAIYGCISASFKKGRLLAGSRGVSFLGGVISFGVLYPIMSDIGGISAGLYALCCSFFPFLGETS